MSSRLLAGLAVNSDSLPRATGKWQNPVIDYHHGKALTTAGRAAILNKEKREMNRTDQFVAETLRQLRRIEDELNEIEAGLRNSSAQVDNWTHQQLAKLKADWLDMKRQLETLSKTHQSEVEASWEQLRNDAEHHWQALHAAVQAYREHVHKNVA